MELLLILMEVIVMQSLLIIHNMSDITKCRGVNCPIKDQCKRYTAKESVWQSYFMESPIKDGKCDMYWGENAEAIFNQLKGILNKQD